MWEDAKKQRISMSFPPVSEKEENIPVRARTRHDRWIMLIGAFKLAQALLFVLLGIGAIRLLHRDLVGIAEHFIYQLRFINPEGRLVNLVLIKVAQIDPHRLRQISAVIFIIAAMDALEGMGLVLEQAWAEFVTLILTASLLPLELWELVRRVTLMKVGLIIINLAVVAYLAFYVRMRMKERRARRTQRAA
jgi:uncharacterized membrane protein (DUF2068 family)